MPTMVDKSCEFCNANMTVRLADVKRGWGRFCSKSCKAKKQEKQNGQYSAYINGRGVSNLHPERLDDYDNRTEYEKYLDDVHPFSSEAHGQWK
jgi:hypothetical protein